MAGRTHVTDALVLRAIDYGDADRIVTLLTETRGKITALARGARKSRRRFGGALEPCCVLHAEVGAGRGELDRLASASIARSFPGLLRDLRKMSIAGAALELVRETTPPKEPDTRILWTSVEMLETLEQASEAREELLLAFQARLLAVAGLAPQLDTCAQCGKRAAEDQAARFDPRLGAVVCRGCGGAPVHLSGATRARLRVALGADWTPCSPWEPRERDQARHALDAFITHQIGRRLAGADLYAQIGPSKR